MLHDWRPAEQKLVSWLPGEVRCADGTAPAAGLRRPFNTLNFSSAAVPAATMRFDIDVSSRPMSISQEEGGVSLGSADFVPALAASRFPAGPARSRCAVTYAPRIVPVGEAAVEELASYTMMPTMGTLTEDGQARLRGTGSCWKAPRPQPLVRAYPDFDRLPATPGVRDWALVGYDTDASGRPRNIRALAGTGNAALTKAAADAVNRSRFTGGARTGCSYPYWRTPATLAAPKSPDPAPLRPAGATCPEDHGWSTPPRPRYPEAFRRRAVEGWAVVSYDVAPWGEPGNLRVLAAQPGAAFGEAAQSALRLARLAPAGQGLTGCVDTVRFLMEPAEGTSPAEPQARAAY